MSTPDEVTAIPSRPSFVRSLVFALAAGIGAYPSLVFFAPLWGYENTTATYLLGSAIVYPVFVGGNWRGRLGTALLIALFAAPLALLEVGVWGAVFAILLMLGVTRSSILAPRRPARALWQESLLGAVSVIAVVLLADYTASGLALAVWSFWLIQSAFPLLVSESSAPTTSGAGGGRTRMSEDGFEKARAAALELLDGV